MSMNKILIIVYVPSIEQTYEVYIPVNKKIGTIKKLLINSVIELSDGEFVPQETIKFLEKDTGLVLFNNDYVKNSNLRNGSEVILI